MVSTTLKGTHFYIIFSILFKDPELTGTESTRKHTVFKFKQDSHTITDINKNEVQILKEVCKDQELKHSEPKSSPQYGK